MIFPSRKTVKQVRRATLPEGAGSTFTSVHKNTPQPLRNLANIMASHEVLLATALNLSRYYVAACLDGYRSFGFDEDILIQAYMNSRMEDSLWARNK